MSPRWLYPLVGLAAFALGTAFWLATRTGSGRSIGSPAAMSAPAIGPAALYATPFADTDGRPQALGQFQGKLVVLNFWATWCAPCREEMPAFTRIQARWKDSGVQIVGVSAEDPGKVARFARDFSIGYPLWVGDAASELTRRLGNGAGVLPHSVILDPSGRVLDEKVGPYSEAELEAKLQTFAGKSS
jgi:thiol-disulfide isomerase/thioredoxin